MAFFFIAFFGLGYPEKLPGDRGNKIHVLSPKMAFKAHKIALL